MIVGGGTAGWITAGRIAAAQFKRQGNKQNGDSRSSNVQNLSITLVESPNRPPIGVGEGTWPTMRNTLRQLGIKEGDFIRECDAAFKQGAQFSGWATGAADDFYYHPLVLPQDFPAVDIAPYWYQQQSINDPKQDKLSSFSKSVCYQESLCEQNLAPKTIRTPEFSAVANYAYHLNSEKFSAMLQKHCVEKLGVRHVVADVVGVKQCSNGDIRSFQLDDNDAELEGDLFIDCTGFKSILLGEHYKVPFHSCRDVLFADTALATRIPYDDDNQAVATHTIATAQDAGWIWDIGLQSRKGVGYVYSSQHSTADDAVQTILRYCNNKVNEADIRKIPINAGYRQTFWKNNCVAVGLSAGFIEPLEASALVLIELSAAMIAEQLPATRPLMDIVAKRFNQTFHYRWQRIIDFLKLHYAITQRDDSDFWRDNRNPNSIPESLQELLALWQYHSPGDHDFTSNNEVFPAASWQYVLFGMKFNTQYHQTYNTDSLASASAHRAMLKNKALIEQLTGQLPKHRELLNKINQYGLQTV